MRLRADRSSFLLGLLGLSVACESPAPEPTPQEWTLAEEVIIGSLDGSGNRPVFGAVSAVVGTPDGGAIVADVQVPAVLQFSAQGAFVRQLGRKGEGPGEYLDISGLASLDSGRVLVRDPRRALMVFGSDGKLLAEYPVHVDYLGDDALAVVGDRMMLRYVTGSFSLKSYWVAPTYGFVRVTLNGEVVDSITPPQPHGPGLYWSPYQPRFHVQWLSDGSMVVGAGSELSLRVVSPQGDTVGRIDRALAKVPLPDAARRRIAEHLAWLKRRGNRTVPYYPDPPTYLPAFDRIVVSRNDELIVLRTVGADQDGVRRVGDAYSRTGEHLGRFEVPRNAEIMSVLDESRMWGVRTGPYGEQYVVRWRVEHPGGSRPN